MGRVASTGPGRGTCWAVFGPPAIGTFRAPAASRARANADSMPSATKKNVVPRFSSGSRAWCVSTNAGTPNGGSSPAWFGIRRTQRKIVEASPSPAAS